MLEIYSVSRNVVRAVVPVARSVKQFDRDLGDQLHRAVVSVPLNIAEGSGQRGGNRRLRYETALGSAREARAALEVASDAGYCDVVDAQVMDQLDRVIATLVKVIRAHAQ